MKNIICLLYLITFCVSILAQNNSENFFLKDKEFHKKELKFFLDSKTDVIEKMVYVSIYGGAKNETVVIIKNVNSKINFYKLTNKKFKNKITKKRFKLCKKKLKRYDEILNLDNIKFNCNEFKSDSPSHKFVIEFNFNGDSIYTSSDCLKEIKQNDIFNHLINLVE